MEDRGKVGVMSEEGVLGTEWLTTLPDCRGKNIACRVVESPARNMLAADSNTSTVWLHCPSSCLYNTCTCIYIHVGSNRDHNTNWHTPTCTCTYKHVRIHTVVGATE